MSCGMFHQNAWNVPLAVEQKKINDFNKSNHFVPLFHYFLYKEYILYKNGDCDAA